MPVFYPDSHGLVAELAFVVVNDQNAVKRYLHGIDYGTHRERYVCFPRREVYLVARIHCKPAAVPFVHVRRQRLVYEQAFPDAARTAAPLVADITCPVTPETVRVKIPTQLCFVHYGTRAS